MNDLSKPVGNPVTALRGRVETVVTNPLLAELTRDPRDRAMHPMLRMLETLLSYGKADDPRVILQALNGYLAANDQVHGIALFDGVLRHYGRDMTPDTRAVYLAGLGVLRATWAEKVALRKRIAWVKDSIEMLEQAIALADEATPIARWAAGTVFAQVPGFMGKRADAYKHLGWLADHPETEPVYGFYREVYHELAKLYRADGDTARSQQYLKRAGYSDYAPRSPMMGWFTNGPTGTQMTPEPILHEPVPGRVFVIYGFGFSDVNFVLSQDGKHLFAVDAATHPRSLEGAHTFLRAHYPDLPEISTAFITHAHWDHVGGHQYLRAQNPDIAIYGSDKYRTVTQRVLRKHSYSYFRGEDFDHAWIESYAPTHPVSARTQLSIGGTKVELVPVTGGETEDAMIIHFPDLDTAFVGDIVMPFFGEPWVNEGYVDEASDTIDTVLDLGASILLHGHYPLSMLFPPDNLRGFAPLLKWVADAATDHAETGYSAKDIMRLNLIPPGLVENPDLYLVYMAARDTLILRVVDKLTGFWREDKTGQSPEGLDVITAVEHGRMLEKYLGFSAPQAVAFVQRMIDNGDTEMALQFAVAAEQRYGAEPAIIAVKEDAADRLRSAAQYLDPFKYTALTEIIGRPQHPMPSRQPAPEPKALT